MATRKIKDAETGMRETYAILGVKPCVVRATVGQHPDHVLERCLVNGRSI
jgi:hypothetical protein